MNKVCVAVIGCGRIASIAHFPAFEAIGNVRVKYACDIIESKAQDKKNSYGFVENVITDYKIALEDKEVEIVYVLTPNYAHYTITMDALKMGKNVFCEKPITVNYALSLEMANEAQKQNKILNIGVCNRFNKSVIKLEEMVKRGDFGNIYHIYCSFRSFRSIPGLGGAFTTKEQSGGGVLIDWGVHILDLALFILGGAKIKTVSCEAYSEMAKNMDEYKYLAMWAEDTKDINGKNDVDDFVSGFIRTDKASISFNGAWAQNIGEEEMYIDFLGDKGGARLNYGGAFTFWTTLNGELAKVQHQYNIPNQFVEENKAFLESVDMNSPNKSNIINVLETAKLLDAIYVSAEKHKEIIL